MPRAQETIERTSIELVRAVNPYSLETLCNLTKNENHTAAYLGFNDKVHFRIFLLQPGIISSYMRFESVISGHHHRIMAILVELHYQRQLIEQFDPNVWPLQHPDPETAWGSRTMHVADTLLRMRRSIQAQDREWLLQSEHQWPQERGDNWSWAKEFTRKYPSLAIGEHTEAPPVTVWPQLGPFAGENEMEALNRVYHILKSIHVMCQNGAQTFNSRFSIDAIKSIPIAASNIPAFMRPASVADNPASTSAPVRVLDPRPVRIIWKRESPAPGKEQLNARVGFDVPVSFAVDKDLRLSDPKEWRDWVRFLFKGPERAMQIHTLRLKFGSCIMDMLADWGEAQNTLDVEGRLNFESIVMVTFKDAPLQPGEPYDWESGRAYV